jgi:hypothetical protein
MNSNTKHNFYYYLDKETIDETAIKLIVFGGEVFKRALIIKNLLPLKDAVIKRDNNQISKSEFVKIAEPFFIENLIDAIRICIFFENYMKSTLIFYIDFQRVSYT